jgi:hypothetical protein
LEGEGVADDGEVSAEILLVVGVAEVVGLLKLMVPVPVPDRVRMWAAFRVPAVVGLSRS